MGASCGGDDRLGDGRDELLLRDAGELVEPAGVVGHGGDVALLERAEVGVGSRSVRRPPALGQPGGQVGPPPLEEAKPGDGVEEAAERDLHVEGAVVGGVGIDEELAQAGLALSVMPYTLRLRFSSRRPDRRTRRRARNPLLQFIAVRLMLLEDPEDRHLDHEGKSIGERLPAHDEIQVLSTWCSPSVCFRCSARLR